MELLLLFRIKRKRRNFVTSRRLVFSGFLFILYEIGPSHSYDYYFCILILTGYRSKELVRMERSFRTECNTQRWYTEANAPESRPYIHLLTAHRTLSYVYVGSPSELIEWRPLVVFLNQKVISKRRFAKPFLVPAMSPWQVFRCLTITFSFLISC